MTGVEIDVEAQAVTSPWCSTYLLDDQLEVFDDGTFSLHGRNDRVVKVNEKRLSLTAIELSLMKCPDIKSARVVPYSSSRLAAFVVVDEGLLESPLRTRQLKTELRHYCTSFMEPSTIPRKWRLLSGLPTTERSKVTDGACLKLLTQDPRLPDVHCATWLTSSALELQMLIEADLPWFKGHFPGQPVLPGVGIIWIVEQYIRCWFEEERPFKQLSGVKFQATVLPQTSLTVKIKYHADKCQYDYSLVNETQIFAKAKFQVEG